MKQRITTYVLLTLVLIIWGIIGYRFLSGRGDKNIPEKCVPGGKEVSAARSYPPLLNYRDPFFKELLLEPEKSAVPKQKRTPPVVEIKEPIDIQCLGSIEKAGEVYYLVCIRSEYYPVKPGDIIGGLNVKRVTEDSIYFIKGKWVYTTGIPEK